MTPRVEVRSMMRISLSFSLIVLVAVVAAFGQTAAGGDGASGAKSDAGFSLKGLDGKTYDTADMRGDVVVASFGASWCAPCVWELVAIEELKVEYAKKPVRFLWVSIESERRTSNNVLRHYAKERKLTIPVLRDPEAKIFSRYSSSTRLPLVVFLDREGRAAPPAHHGMPQDITGYKLMMRERIDALLGAGRTRSDAATEDTERD